MTCWKPFWYLLGVYQDAREFQATLSFQPLTDLFRVVMLIVLVSMQTSDTEIIPTQKLGEVLSTILIVSQCLSFVLDGIMLYVEICECSCAKATFWLEILNLPCDGFLLII